MRLRYTPPGTIPALVAAYEDDQTRGDLTPAEWMERGKKVLATPQHFSKIAEAVRRAYG